MRKFMLLLAVLGLAGSLWAANPDVGTWKLNLAQSKFSGPAPKEETLVVRVVSGQHEITFTGTEPAGKSFSVTYTYPEEGGTVKSASPAPAGGADTTAFITVVNPSNFYSTTLKDGKQMSLQHIVISEDGKTKHRTITGKNSQGKPLNEVQVWEKQ